MRMNLQCRLPLCLVFCLLVLFLPGCGSAPTEVEPPIFDPIRVLVPEAPGEKIIGEDRLVIDVSNTQYGYMVATAEEDERLKSIQVTSTKGGVTYSYFLESGETAVIPLTDGSDTYKIDCYLQVEGNTYCTLFKDEIKVRLENPFYPYLYPNQYVSFDDKTEACILAQEMLPPDAIDIDALEVIYDYVVTHITYDEEKAQTVQPGYLPDVDETLHSGKGICFDYAALTTAMLRARNIPCRLVIGYAGVVKHAWIDVYIRNKGWVEQAISFNGETWERMDPTFYSNSTDEDFILNYIGDGENYNQQYAH